MGSREPGASPDAGADERLVDEFAEPVMSPQERLDTPAQLAILPAPSMQDDLALFRIKIWDGLRKNGRYRLRVEWHEGGRRDLPIMPVSTLIGSLSDASRAGSTGQGFS